MYFIQYANLLFNCETQYLKRKSNLSLFLSICGKCLLTEREYLANQLKSILKQSTEHKEKQLKREQMSAWEQIGKEVQKTAKPSVADLAKQNILSLSKEAVMLVLNQK